MTEQTYRLTIAVFIHSLYIISLQVILMRVLSIMQWDAFAGLIIGIAMLGFGVAGTVLSIFRYYFSRHGETLVVLLMLVTALVIQLAYKLSQSQWMMFDTLLVFQSTEHFMRFVAFVLLFFVPFFCGSLVFGILFTTYVQQIHRLYFANLLGSAAGGVVAFLLLELMNPSQALITTSVFPVIAALFLQKSGKKFYIIFASIVLIFITVWHFIFPTTIRMSQYKSLSNVLLLPDAQKVLEQHSFMSDITVVKSEYLHYTTSVSLLHSHALPPVMYVFRNGNYAGVVPLSGEATDVLERSFLSLALKLSDVQRVLVVHSGTGFYALYAAHAGADTIYAVEPDAGLLRAMEELSNKGFQNPYSHPAITLCKTNIRLFLDSTSQKFDLIILPTIGHTGLTAHQRAIAEEYELTREAFCQYWSKLSDDGILYVSSFLDTPLRSSLKLMWTLADMLEQAKVKDLHNHLLVIRNWNSLGFLVKKNSFTEENFRQVATFCQAEGFDLLIHPYARQIGRQQFHILKDTSLFHYFDYVMNGLTGQFAETYEFRVSPTTDDRPYFTNFVSMKNLKRLLKEFSFREIYFLESSYFLLWISLVILIACSAMFMVLPLIGMSQVRGKWKVVLYFGSIGLAFMMLEILLIQRFAFYTGNVLYSTILVLTLMLLFSGIGSYFSETVSRHVVYWKIIFPVLVLFVILLPVISRPVMEATLTSPFLIKIGVMMLMIGIPALVMGMPFPLGMKYFGRENERKIAWGWGINGFMSVCAVPIATLLAVEIGAQFVFLCCAICYAIPFFIVNLRAKDR